MTLLQDINAFLRETGMAPTRFGKRAVNDAAFVRRLRAGRETTARTEQRVRQFLAGYRRGASPAAVTQPAMSPPAEKPGKFRVSAAVIRSAKVDGRDLPTFVTALIDMGAGVLARRSRGAWGDGRVRPETKHARPRAAAPVSLADQMIAWIGWRAGDPVDNIAYRLGRHRPAVRAILFGEAAR